MNRRNPIAVPLTLAIVSCVALAQETATRPSGPHPGADETARAALQSATAPAAASAPATEAAEEEDPLELLPPYYQTMSKECDMAVPQQRQMAARYKLYAAELDVWNKANAEQRKAMQMELVQAFKEHNKDAVSDLKGKLADLDRARKNLENKLDADIDAVLTPRQRSTWEGYLIYAQVITSFTDLKLDEDQVNRVRVICTRGAPRLAKVKDNKPEADKFYDELYKSIRDRVLTPEQRDKLDHKPATAPATAPSAKPE